MLGGADQHDLARLAREMLDRAQARPDRDNDGFEERALWLGTTFGGAGRLHADLTPACAAALTVVLEALGQKAGPEDTRTAAQRRHDAIEEACRRLIGGQMIGGRDGQPPHLSVHIDLTDLAGLRGGSALERSWTPAKAAAGPGSAYLTGPAAEAAACDAVLTTIVTGQIDWQVLDQLTTVWLTTHGHGHTGSPPEDHPAGPPESHADGPRDDHAGKPGGRPPGRAAGRPGGRAAGTTTRTGRRKTTRTGRGTTTRTGHGTTRRTGRRKTTRTGRGTTRRTGQGKATRTGRRDTRHGRPTAATRTSQLPAPATPGLGPGAGPAFPGTGHSPAAPDPAATDGHDCAISGCLEATRQRLHATILRWSLDLLSGPGGLACHLRGTLLGAPFNTPSQPLDLGRTTRTIPPHLRTAVIQRDKHCLFPGCTQPPSVCEVHHLIPWAKGGPTSLGNLRLLCRFHHHIAIHRWGWTITCHPDGTRTATGPDGRTLALPRTTPAGRLTGGRSPQRADRPPPTDPSSAPPGRTRSPRPVRARPRRCGPRRRPARIVSH